MSAPNSSASHAATMSGQPDQDSTHVSPKIRGSLYALAFIFFLTVLLLQAFNLVFEKIGDDLQVPQQASLITAAATIVLGIVGFVYGSLGDFVSLRKMSVIGVIVLVASSVSGYFFHDQLWLVVLARCLQTAGGQASGSVYLVLVAKYVHDSKKIWYYSIFTASYQLASAIGVLAGGLFVEIEWSYLFLIGLFGAAVLPILAKWIPDNSASGARIDVPGFVIFAFAISLLTVFFTNYNIWLIAGSAALFIIFAFYVNKASNPFITTDFFKNKRWLIGVSMIFLWYFTNYSITPLFNKIGQKTYNLPASTVSQFLVWATLTSLTSAMLSSHIVRKIGREYTLLLASVLLATGLLLSSLLVTVNLVVLTITVSIYYAGVGMIYSPIYDVVLAMLPVEDAGRGIGLNDLVLNVTSSIGVAIIGGFIGATNFSGASLIGQSGMNAQYSNIFLICAGIMIFATILYYTMRKTLHRPGDDA